MRRNYLCSFHLVYPGRDDMNILEKLLILLLIVPNLINRRTHICDSLNEINKEMAAYHLSSPTSSLWVHSGLRQFRQPTRGLCYWHAATMKKPGTGQILKSLSLSLSLSLILSLNSKFECHKNAMQKLPSHRSFLSFGTDNKNKPDNYQLQL